MRARVAAHRRGAGPRRPPLWPTCPSTCGRRTPTSCCSGPATRSGDRGVAGPGRAVGAGAQLRLVASPRGLPACHDRHARGGRRLPGRPPRGARMTRSATRQRDHQGDVGLGRHRPRRPRGQGPRGHRAAVLRPHARPARAPRRVRPHRRGAGRPARRRPPHGRGRRHRARRVLPRGAGRQGGRAPVRQRGVPARRGAGRGGARPVGPAVRGLRRAVRRRAAAGRPAVQPRDGRALLAVVRHRRPASPCT